MGVGEAKEMAKEKGRKEELQNNLLEERQFS